MTLSNLHSIANNYAALRRTVLGKLEGEKDRPYFDTAAERNPTIGIGFNIGSGGIRGQVLAAMGVTDAAVVARINTVLDDRTIRALPAGIGPGHRDTVLQQRLDAALGSPFVMTDGQIQGLFESEVEAREQAITNSSGVPSGTREMLALLSLEYNNVYWQSHRLQAALNAGNRAEAWYEIRYSHADQLQPRRYAEAALFGLYGENLSESERLQEALDIYRMYTKHRDDRTQTTGPTRVSVGSDRSNYLSVTVVVAFACQVIFSERTDEAPIEGSSHFSVCHASRAGRCRQWY